MYLYASIRKLARQVSANRKIALYPLWARRVCSHRHGDGQSKRGCLQNARMWFSWRHLIRIQTNSCPILLIWIMCIDQNMKHIYNAFKTRMCLKSNNKKRWHGFLFYMTDIQKERTSEIPHWTFIECSEHFQKRIHHHPFDHRHYCPWFDQPAHWNLRRHRSPG